LKDRIKRGCCAYGYSKSRATREKRGKRTPVIEELPTEGNQAGAFLSWGDPDQGLTSGKRKEKKELRRWRNPVCEVGGLGLEKEGELG